MYRRRMIEQKMRRKLRSNYRTLQVNKYNNYLRILPCFSNKHISVQIFDTQKNVTVAASSSMEKWFRENKELKSYNTSGAIAVGQKIAEIIKSNFGDRKFYFDRNGKIYHGKLKALCDAIRNSGIDA